MNDILAKNRANKAVINLSLGACCANGIDQVWLDAIAAALRQNILTTISAGNDAAPVAQDSPGNVPFAITVGASDQSFAMADFSNYGPGIDFFAPGVDVFGAGAGSDTDGILASGTSTSAPLVAGVAMYLQSILNLGSSTDLLRAMQARGVARMAGDLKGSPNLFVNNGNGVA